MTGLLFRCSSCERSIEIDVGMREALREAGCPVCGGSVGSADFESR